MLADAASASGSVVCSMLSPILRFDGRAPCRQGEAYWAARERSCAQRSGVDRDANDAREAVHVCVVGEQRRLSTRDADRSISLTADRVLVVEDNAVNRQVLEAMLTSLGYRADVAVNGADALEAIARVDYAPYSWTAR